MKSGLTIVEMAQQIERQSKLKQDYLLDTRRLQVEPFGSQLYLHTFDDHDDPLVEPLEINQIAHRQIGTHLKIPAAYYDRMLSDYPELLAENVNSWFQREPTQRMVPDGCKRSYNARHSIQDRQGWAAHSELDAGEPGGNVDRAERGYGRLLSACK